MSADAEWAAAIRAARESKRLDAVADLCDRRVPVPSSAWPVLATLFRDFRQKSPGRKPSRINGYTPRHYQLADAYEHYHALLAEGHDDFAASDLTRKKFGKPPIPENVLYAVLKLTRSEVNAILRERGVLADRSK